MPDPLDLAGDIASAIDGAALRNATVALAYVRDDGSPSVSFRGSTLVHSTDQLALWAHKARQRPGDGDRRSSDRLRVSLSTTLVTRDRARVLAIEGQARVAPEVNEQVWDVMIEGERTLDPEGDGVAGLIDVDSVSGAGADGFFQRRRLLSAGARLAAPTQRTQGMSVWPWRRNGLRVRASARGGATDSEYERLAVASQPDRAFAIVRAPPLQQRPEPG